MIECSKRINLNFFLFLILFLFLCAPATSVTPGQKMIVLEIKGIFDFWDCTGRYKSVTTHFKHFKRFKRYNRYKEECCQGFLLR